MFRLSASATRGRAYLRVSGSGKGRFVKRLFHANRIDSFLRVLFYSRIFGPFAHGSSWTLRWPGSSRAFRCQNNLSSTQDFVALNCFQPRMTLISAPCCQQAFVSFHPPLPSTLSVSVSSFYLLAYTDETLEPTSVKKSLERVTFLSVCPPCLGHHPAAVDSD